MFNHSVSDLVAIIKNGYLAKKAVVHSPVSSLRAAILDLLKAEGFISGYTLVTTNKKKKVLKSYAISLKYHYSNPAVNDIEVVSKPGKRIYSQSTKIPVEKNGLGMFILSTSAGILPDYEARDKKRGGELLLRIF